MDCDRNRKEDKCTYGRVASSMYFYERRNTESMSKRPTAHTVLHWHYHYQTCKLVITSILTGCAYLITNNRNAWSNIFDSHGSYEIYVGHHHASVRNFDYHRKLKKTLSYSMKYHHRHHQHRHHHHRRRHVRMQMTQ